MSKKSGNGTAKKGLKVPTGKKNGSGSKVPKVQAKKATKKTTVIKEKTTAKKATAKKATAKKAKKEMNPNGLGPHRVTKLKAPKIIEGHQFKNFGDFQGNLSKVYAFHFYTEQALAAKDGNIAVGNGYKIITVDAKGKQTVIKEKITKRTLEAVVDTAAKKGIKEIHVGMGFNHTHSLAHYVKGDYIEAASIRFMALYWKAPKDSPKSGKKNAGKAKKS